MIYRLEETEAESQSLRSEMTSLRAELAGKERENALYREELTTMSELLAKYKDRLTATEGSQATVEKQ